MADTLKVRAVEGRMCPFESPRVGHVGYSVAGKDDTVHHSIGDVVNLTRSSEPVEVPNTVYYRKAVTCGDLEQAQDAPVRREALRAKVEV